MLNFIKFLRKKEVLTKAYAFTTSERRFEIMKYLCKNRIATMPMLAHMYHVSVRTIKRDIDELGGMIPIITQQGRFGGGVQIMEGYSWDKSYMNDDEIALLKEVRDIAQQGGNLYLNNEKLLRLDRIIEIYEKPKNQKPM